MEIISTDNHGRFSISLMEGIEDALGTANSYMFLCNAANDPDCERKGLTSKGMEGLIFTARRTDLDPLHVPCDLPVLYAYAQTFDPTSVCFLLDDEVSGKLT